MRSRGERIVRASWEPRGIGGRILRSLLLPLRIVYSGVVRLRSLSYRLHLRRARKLSAAVVSIGNLTVGGTGKTPAALWVAERLRARGYRVSILSRGYGGSARKPTIVQSGATSTAAPSEGSDWRVVGDETLLLARRFSGPVIVARRRVEGGELACSRFGANVLVLDDGFQHRSLARQFDLVCVRHGSLADTALLPAGPLREPVSALRRASAVLLTKSPGGEGVEALVRSHLRDRPLYRGDLRALCLVTPASGGWEELPLARLAGRRALAVAGVADPTSFYRTLHEWEARVEDFLEFSDHHAYTLDDWKKIAHRSRDLDLVVTTEKDLVKLEQFPFAREKLVAVRVSLEVEGGDELIDLIMRAIEPALAGGARTDGIGEIRETRS